MFAIEWMAHVVAQAAGPEVTNVAQLGVSGLMGALWWWERKYSRQREDELTEAHKEILGQREHLQALLDALEGNTRVISQFTAVQEEILRAMQRGTGVRRRGRRLLRRQGDVVRKFLAVGEGEGGCEDKAGVVARTGVGREFEEIGAGDGIPAGAIIFGRDEIDLPVAEAMAFVAEGD